MTDSNSTAPQARLYVGMGGSGIKTLAEFVSLLTQHSEESKKSEVFMAYLLVDTDGGELDMYKKRIDDAYRHIHREPIIRTVHLSADITDFASFVATKLQKGGHHERLKEVWWYRSDRPDEPFTALNLKDAPTKGAGQCPLVSTFLAWNQMRQIDATIDDLLNDLKNRSVQGENLQNWTLDVSLVSSLAGGTGRGCWHLVASKIREKLRDLNVRPKPVGFFFDSSVFAEDVKREEQVMKLRVNSITGVSELVAWLRNEYERDTDLTPFRFQLPSLEHPGVPSSDLIDTAKLSSTVAGEQLLGVSGRAPISAAYLIFGAGKQGTLGEASAYYRSVANALYARLFGSTASKNINEAGHLNGLAAATISVSIAGIQEYVREYVQLFLPSRFSAVKETQKCERVADAFVSRLMMPDVVEQTGKPDADNVPQRIYHTIISRIGGRKHHLEETLKERHYEEAESTAAVLAKWPEEQEEEIAQLVRQDVVLQLWGTQNNSDKSSVGGNLRTAFELAVELTKQDYNRIFGESDDVKPVNPISEAAHRLLREPAVTMQSAGRSETLDMTSYGTKHAIATLIHQKLIAIAKRLENDRAMPDSSQDVVSPAEELRRARTGFLKTSVSEEEADNVLASVERWVVLKSNKAIRNHLSELLYDAADDITALAAAFADVTKQLVQSADDHREATGRSKDNNFWNDKDFERILKAGRSTFEQEILSAQTLQAVADDESLQDQFESLMTKESSVGFHEARRNFVAHVQHWIDEKSHWIDEKSRSPDSTLNRKLPDIIHENLKGMADQFMLPDDFYEDHFGFLKTVEGLVRSWGNKMIDRMGSPQDKQKLSSVFRNQFGIDYPESKGRGPKELDQKELENFTFEVCRAMAIRLGGRCDPLFQQRFDEGERPTYDNVAVVLPTERKFDKLFAEEAEREAKRNPQFAAAGQFSVVPTCGTLDAGNPYTMFAYATQQFEDWRNDSGMARIASLEYYKTPAVLNWLRACEDPTGASVFLDSKELKRFGISSCRDIYGLGFISPLFVHDKTLKELRWSPWDESKARSKDKRSDRIDLLAYALLKTPPTDCAKHFEAVLKKADWTWPLLAWRDGRAEDALPTWHFMRRAIRKCTEVTATKERDASHQAFAEHEGYPSIRRCIDELLANDAIASAIAGEAGIFMSEILCNNDYADDFNPDRDIRTAFRYLGDRLIEAKTKQDGPAADKMKALIDELIARVTELGNYSPEKLKEHFEKIRKNSELLSRA
jgi:hypothetical protein